MSNALLAGIKFNWRGAYTSSNVYANNDAVSFQGASFAAITSVSNGPPMASPASPSGTRFVVTASGTTFRFAETRPVNADACSSSPITASSANPSLSLKRGSTYIFDFSNVPSTLTFALRVTASDAATGIAGALANNISIGSSTATFPYVDANNRQQLHTAANKVITYTVPYEDATYYTSLVYVSPLNTAAVGTINLVNPTVTALVASSWKQIANYADDIASRGAGSLLTVGTSAGAGATYAVTNSGTGAYVIDGTNNASLTLVRGVQYTFTLNATGHPFWIQTVSGAYSSGNIYSTGVTNNGTQSGTIQFTVPNDAPNTLYYACQYHSSMQGTINIVTGNAQLATLESSTYNYELSTQGSSGNPIWTAPKGKKNQRMALVAPPTVWNVNQYDQTQTNCMPRSRRGHIQGSRMGTWIMPDRRSLKSAGYNYQGGLGYNTMSDQYAAPYTGNRYNTNLQYCQFDEAGLAPDDQIAFVESNNSFQLLVTKRGRMYFVGYNGYGQMGFGDTNNRYVFTRNSFFGDLEGKTVVDAQITFDGEASSGNQNTVMVMTAEGEMYAAGYNGYGQLGDGTTTTRTFFQRIGESTLNRLGKKITNYVWNGCSDYYSMTIAWNESNECYVWGNNNNGDFGFGDTTQRSLPTRMTTLESTITPNSYPLTVACLRSSITSTGVRLTTAILFSDNHIYVAGKSNHGQLGNNVPQSTDQYTYAQVTRPAGKLWAQLHGSGGASGTYYGLTTDGFLYAWGYNGYGQIADATTTNRTVPTLCSELETGVQGTITNIWVYGGDSYSCVWIKTSTGKWYTWGWYGCGSLMQNRNVPDTWNTTTTPRQITNYLPFNGVGLSQVGVRRAHGNNQTISLEYANGEVFYVGQNNFTGFNPSGGDGSGYSQDTIYYFQYPKQATSFMF